MVCKMQNRPWMPQRNLKVIMVIFHFIFHHIPEEKESDRLSDDLRLSTSSEENDNEIEQMDDSKKDERDSMIVNKSSSPIRLSSPSFSPQKIAKEALRARRMGDGDYRDALEIMGFFDDDNFLVKMKDPKEPALCNRKAAKQNLPQLVIKFYESVINWT